jgi:thiol:disulfide interchange protein/DsbC/DsbD-like thiol-disulfide interchange protein
MTLVVQGPSMLTHPPCQAGAATPQRKRGFYQNCAIPGWQTAEEPPCPVESNPFSAAVRNQRTRRAPNPGCDRFLEVQRLPAAALDHSMTHDTLRCCCSRLRVALRLLVAGLAAIGMAVVAVAAPVRTPHVEAELVAETTALVPGTAATVALRLRMEPGWHVYWRNPGDSGLPTTIAWTLPPGVVAGPIQWPAPRALPAGPLVNYGYEGEVLHLVDLAVAPSLAAGSPVNLGARVDWLVCKETCIPEGVDLALTLPVATTAEADGRWSAAIAATRSALPRPLSAWQASAEGRGPTIALKLVPPSGAADPGAVRFFPVAERQIEPSGAQVAAREDGALILTLPVASDLDAPMPRLAGVITAGNSLGAGVNAASIDVALTGSVAAGPKPALVAGPKLNLAPPAPAAGGLTLWLAVLSAVLGGVLLNLMPCVFPVLSIKVLGFATHHDRPATLRREALAYAGGVVLTFVVLGLALFALRAAGEQLGWGFQLQSPTVVTGLALLFFVLALNLSGVFEFGQLAPSGVAGWTARNRALDAFASGVLAVIVASPCTAPFMGAALGFALAGSAWVTLVVFVALGVGMAIPYVLLAWFPTWRRRLPRSGPWLARFRQLLAFPLYVTVVWLVWVLGAQTDNDTVARLLLCLLGIGFALWAWRIVRGGGARLWGAAGLAALALATVVAWPLFGSAVETPPRAAAGPGAATPGEADWLAFSPARVAQLNGAGRTVFVDFTAAWCVTCQVNKRLVLNDGVVRDAFARSNVALVRADWTRRDPVITQVLTALGRSGVPVYVLYRPGKEPLLLPEVLQRKTVLDALAAL